MATELDVINKKPQAHGFMALLESVFGKFRKDQPTESKKRRCHRCRDKYDPAKVKHHYEEHDGQAALVAFDHHHFCSYECSVDQDSYSVTSRQSLRHALRQTAKVTIAHQMGAGPAAMNPRRSRRKAVREMAKRLYRER